MQWNFQCIFLIEDYSAGSFLHSQFDSFRIDILIKKIGGLFVFVSVFVVVSVFVFVFVFVFDDIGSEVFKVLCRAVGQNKRERDESLDRR